MVIKGMSYALNNPPRRSCTRPPATASSLCKSWIDTFGQRSAKAGGSLITNAFATSLYDLNNYGTMIGVVLSVFLIWVSKEMGAKFEELQADGVKVGEEEDEAAQYALDTLADSQQKLPSSEDEAADQDTSCLEDGDKPTNKGKKTVIL